MYVIPCILSHDNIAILMLHTVKKETFEAITKEDIEEMKTLYSNQCASIYNQGMKTEIGLLQIIAIGVNNKFDYLQNLVDVYDRIRVKKADTQYVITYKAPALSSLSHTYFNVIFVLMII